MKVCEAKYTRKFNTGDYNSEEYSLTATLDDKDNAQKVIASLKADVEAAHAGAPAEAAPEEEKPKKKKSAPKEEEEEKPKKKKKPVEEEPEDDDEDSDDDEDEDDSDDEGEGDDEEGSDDEDDDEEEEPAPKAKSKSKRKPQVYNRELTQHKDLFSKVLSAVSPKWNSNPKTKELAKQASRKMAGKEFLDDKGDVLTSFKSEVKKLMSKK